MPDLDDYIRMDAKHLGRCAECGAWIEPGDPIIYEPDRRKVYCEDCGEYLLE